MANLKSCIAFAIVLSRGAVAIGRLLTIFTNMEQLDNVTTVKWGGASCVFMLSSR